MTTNAYPLILASTAPWRAELLRTKFRLRNHGPALRRVFSHRAKTLRPGTELRMVGKARASAALRPNAYILAADQTAEFEGQCLQKPKDLAGCASQLRQLQGGTHYLHSAVALYSPVQADINTRIITVTLTMKVLSSTDVDDYVLRTIPSAASEVINLSAVAKISFTTSTKRRARSSAFHLRLSMNSSMTLASLVEELESELVRP